MGKPGVEGDRPIRPLFMYGEEGPQYTGGRVASNERSGTLNTQLDPCGHELVCEQFGGGAGVRSI